MDALTDAQKETLQKMSRFHVVTQFATGAVVVVSDQLYQNACVIETDGQVYAISRYLAIIDRHR